MADGYATVCHADDRREVFYTFWYDDGGLLRKRSTVENLYYLQGKLYQFFSVLARGIEIQQYVDDTKESIHEIVRASCRERV